MTRTFTGWHMAAITISFFAIIIAVNLTLALFASSSWTGLVVANSYVASQTFNRDAAEARQQQSAGWRMTLMVKGGLVQVSILNRDGQPLRGLRLRAVLQRPTDEAEDQRLVLRDGGDGIYSARAPVGRGIWMADITAEGYEHKPVRFVQRIFVE